MISDIIQRAPYRSRLLDKVKEQLDKIIIARREGEISLQRGEVKSLDDFPQRVWVDVNIRRVRSNPHTTGISGQALWGFCALSWFSATGGPQRSRQEHLYASSMVDGMNPHLPQDESQNDDLAWRIPTVLSGIEETTPYPTTELWRLIERMTVVDNGPQTGGQPTVRLEMGSLTEKTDVMIDPDVKDILNSLFPIHI